FRARGATRVRDWFWHGPVAGGDGAGTQRLELRRSRSASARCWQHIAPERRSGSEESENLQGRCESCTRHLYCRCVARPCANILSRSLAQDTPPQAPPDSERLRAGAARETENWRRAASRNRLG